MRTALDIEPDLLDEVIETTGESRAVSKALKEYVRRTRLDEFRAMAGKIPLDDTRAEQREADRRRHALLDELRDGHRR